ncbi:MAG TPA: lipoyl(octanoyl) transferase [Chloroflexi bacterium]|nr:lipoyl(octanoyl) transferase [Chloroflexota bacterium]
MPKPICQILHLGLINYQQAWDLQNEFAAQIAEGTCPPTLLMLEHPHTFTFGRRGNATNLLWDEPELARRGVAVHWVDRGGDVTYHGPGQLVGYPLIPLGLPRPRDDEHIPQVDYVGYIRKLERTIIAAVTELGVEAQQVEGLTGVWVDGQSAAFGSPIAKLAAIGVKVDAHGITRHGFALNVDPDMEYWEGIIGCGLTTPEISLAQLLDPVPTMERVITGIEKHFGEIFEFELISKE